MSSRYLLFPGTPGCALPHEVHSNDHSDATSELAQSVHHPQSQANDLRQADSMSPA